MLEDTSVHGRTDQPQCLKSTEEVTWCFNTFRKSVNFFIWALNIAKLDLGGDFSRQNLIINDNSVTLVGFCSIYEHA